MPEPNLPEEGLTPVRVLEGTVWALAGAAVALFGVWIWVALSRSVC